MRRCVYPGSFNPAHLGHMHVILQASRLFDEVRVLIAVNPEKTYRVSAEDRRAILENLVGTLPCHNVSVDISDRPLIEYYDKMDMDAVIRGVRNEADFGSVCRKYKPLRYIPAEWDWHAYPDVGFADIVGDKDRLTWGCHRYVGDTAEDVIRRESDGKEFIVDTKDELRELIRDTFGA